MAGEKRKAPTNLTLFEDPEIPFIDDDDDDNLISELSQNFLECDDEDDNLIGELSQQFLEYDDDDDLFGETSQIFMEESQFFHNLPLYYHVGSGFENRPGPTSSGPPYVAGPSHERTGIEAAVILEEQSCRQNSRYRGEERIFRARVNIDRLPDSLRNSPILAAVEGMRELFRQLLERSTEGLRPHDLIRICIQADGLDKPISTNIMKVSDMTIEKAMSTIMKVLQSKEEIKLDNGFKADVITIHRDVGSGRQKVINIEIDRLKKTSIVSIPSDNRQICCAKAIVTAIAHLEDNKPRINSFRDTRRPALKDAAMDLHDAAGVPPGPCTYSEVAVFEEHLNCQIAVFSSDKMNKLAYKGKDRPRRINLWLHHEHYDVIKNLRGFYGAKNYCEKCDKAYDHSFRHRCAGACFICLRNECISGIKMRCADCDRLCESEDCFRAHKAKAGNQQLSICDRVYQCPMCCKKIERADCTRENHVCGTSKCPSCKQYVQAGEHRCFLKRVKAKDTSDRIIFFDFETDQSSGEHVVNFAVAQYTSGEEKVFSGYTACDDFCSWLFTAKHKQYTAIAHNMKGFDGQFIMAWMLDQGTTPDVIPNGSKVMSIKHPSLRIRVIDSFNFLPMGLSKLPACFGLKEIKKGYFPHFFNVRANQKYVGSFPDVKYFSPDTMTSKAREDFLAWYSTQADQVFDFEKEMKDYCRSDVDILRRCCLEFQTQFLAVANVDPFRYITIAAACMDVFRSGHIDDNTIAMVPVGGYVNNTRFSADGIRWILYVSQTEGITIQHALSPTGEIRIGGLSVDGYCRETNTVYQYQGCFFHGCLSCFDGDAVHPFKQCTMAVLRKKTEDVTTRLQAQGYQVIEMWEHDFQKLKKEKSELQRIISTCGIKDRLVPRDAFFGGRTNAVQLFYEGRAKYVDFTSLYPWVNKYCRYPVGHPTILTENIGDLNQYFGLVKCTVVPPRGLFLPVLPFRCQGKLMFPLCRTCAETMQQSPCVHSEEERAILGTWVTEEVKVAIDKGYTITEIHEVYHFEDSSDSLFKTYIDLFLKIKQESSGWPQDCLTEQQRDNYIEEYMKKEGVQLDKSAIAKNPGRRQVAKLALNSFWGRWGMNINKSKLVYVNSLAKFNKMLSDSTKNIRDIYFPTPEMAAFDFARDNRFVPQDTATNIFLAAFTTAWARLKLYSEMEKLGRAVLYHDTDSIVYASDGKNDPPLGNFLGDFTDELNGDVITTFVSGGPKNYAYETTAGKSCCKVRGFTLNFCNAQLLNFCSIKDMVCSLDPTATITICNDSKITRDAKRRKVQNKVERKLYRVVYDKRVVKPDFSTLPYGY